MAKPTFDVAAAHRFFSADCFNKAWDLIGKGSRTIEEDEEMIRLNQASMWHWTQRADCSDRNMSIGYWQASRIYAIIGRADESRWYGQLCLRCSKRESPFYTAYAHEALARAERVAGNSAEVEKHLSEARRLAQAVTDPEEKKLLMDDLDTIDPSIA